MDGGVTRLALLWVSSDVRIENLNLRDDGVFVGVTLVGDADDDVLPGTAGDDNLDGGAGDDHINGLDGSDLLQGGEGDDVVLGGNGNDTFVVGNSSVDLGLLSLSWLNRLSGDGRQACGGASRSRGSGGRSESSASGPPGVAVRKGPMRKTSSASRWHALSHV